MCSLFYAYAPSHDSLVPPVSATSEFYCPLFSIACGDFFGLAVSRLVSYFHFCFVPSVFCSSSVRFCIFPRCNFFAVALTPMDVMCCAFTTYYSHQLLQLFRSNRNVESKSSPSHAAHRCRTIIAPQILFAIRAGCCARLFL